jgi:endonuclease YncB( thermonuclease family)
VSLIASKQVDLEPFEQDSHDRLVARVYLNGGDVNGTLVQQGYAWAFRQYMTRDDAAYCEFEHDARTHRRGLWALPPEQRVAPWERRKHPTTFTDYSGETAEQCIADNGTESSAPSRIQPLLAAPPERAHTGADGGQTFTCGTKTLCREMTSCEEARFYLTECDSLCR